MRKQYVTKSGWLSEDGILDEQAAWMAAFGDRRPMLTYREALLAVLWLIRRGYDRAYVAERLGIEKHRATVMMTTVKRTMLNV